MLSTGDQAPDFTLSDQSGQQVSLSGLLASGPVVLFFYPKAMTSGCTKESCHFRDLAGEFAEVGAQRVGISADKVDKQAAFDAKHDLGYPLLSDADRSVASAFGVKRPGPIFNKRATFVIGVADGAGSDQLGDEHGPPCGRGVDRPACRSGVLRPVIATSQRSTGPGTPLQGAFALLDAAVHDPTVTGVGRLPMRSPAVPFPDGGTARLDRPDASPWWRSLDGDWDVRFFDSLAEVRLDRDRAGRHVGPSRCPDRGRPSAAPTAAGSCSRTTRT
jgi:peroxiredoxin Q/BCP